MTQRRRPFIALAITVVALLLLGFGVSAAVSDALGLRTESVDIPTENPVAAPERETVLPPEFTSIDVEGGRRTDLAVAELRDAVAAASGSNGTATLSVSFDSPLDGDDSYTLGGASDALTITAGSLDGAVRGIYDLAAAVRDGRSVAERLGQTVSSALPFRMADLGAVGVPEDTDAYAAGTDYSHNSNAFADAILPEAPYVDPAGFATVESEFDAYVAHLLAEGYTAIAVPGFLEYVTFDAVGDGTAIYPKGDEHVARAEAMRATFGQLWKKAADLGLDVYLRTDMLALSTPLEAYFERELGGIDAEDPRLWDVYERGFDELYAAMPWLSGTVIRIGEAGSVYDLDEWDYSSALAVTSVAAVREMLTALTEEAEKADTEVIFRSWSVGVGAVGDMHTDAESYHAVLDGIDSPALIVSTKYTLGDFYSYLPFNDTLETGDQRRIVELQSRREFEDFGALPNDLGSLYSQALQRFIAANPHVEGIWAWTQDGGPWRAGPMTMVLKTGFWQLYELNSSLAVRLARDPEADPAEITDDWIHRWFTDDPATAAAIGAVMGQSRDAITHGLYIGPFAEKKVYAIGLEPPPMMWIFEWDILTGDSAVLDVIYAVSRDRLDEAIDGGTQAVEAATAMRDALAATDPDTWKTPALRDAFTDTLDYEVNLFQTLGTYREMVLRHAQWLDTGSAEAQAQWASAKDAFEAAARTHVERYSGNLDYPAYNLTAAQLGVQRAELDEPMAWAARVLLALVLLWFVLGLLRVPFARAARATLVAGTMPWRAAAAVSELTAVERVLVVAVPAVAVGVSRGILTWFLAPAHLLVTLGSWLVFAVGLAIALRRRDPWPVIAAVGGAAMLRVAVLLIALVGRGPGGYWFGFWTDPVARSVYITVSFALFAWVIAAGAWALAGQLGRVRAAGWITATVGAVLAIVGAFIGAIGLEAAMTMWNDQLALLPWGLSRILGLTVYLEIPADTPWFAAAFGAVLLVIGLLLAFVSARRAKSSNVTT